MGVLGGALVTIVILMLCVGAGAAVRSVVQDLLDGNDDDDPD